LTNLRSSGAAGLRHRYFARRTIINTQGIEKAKTLHRSG